MCSNIQVNCAGFPVEINGAPDLHQRTHIYGVTLKSHEDTLACYDVLHAIAVAAHAASGGTYVFKPEHSVFDRAWAFLYSTKDFIKKASKPARLWYEDSSCDEEDMDAASDDGDQASA